MPHRIPADGNKIIRVYSTKEVDLLIQGVIQLQDSATNAPGGGGGGSVLWSTIVNNPFELVGVEQIGTGIFRYTSELRSDADVVAYYSAGGTAPDLTDLLTGAITIGSGKTLVHQDSSPTVIIQANGLINPAAIDGGIGGGTATWGGITGTLSDQTDLQSALDGKSNTGHTHTLSEITDLASTTDLPEGTNLYYTTARANTAIDARVNKAFVDALNVDADTLDGLNSLQFLRSDQSDTIEGTLTIDSDAGQALTIKGGTADHVYIGLFADSAAQSIRSAYIGFPSGGSDTLTIANEQGSLISLADNTSITGTLDVSSNIELITNNTYLRARTTVGSTRIHGINASNVEFIGSIDQNVVNTIIGTTTDQIQLRVNSDTKVALTDTQIQLNQNTNVTGIITATGEIRSDDDIVAYYSSGGTAPDLTDLLTGAIVIGTGKTLTHQSSSPTVLIQSNGLINPAAIDGGVGGSSATWGNITGTLADQTDLQSALDGKSNTGHTHTAAEIASGVLSYDRLPISSAQVATWGTAYDRSITGISNIIANAGRIRLSRQDGTSLEDDLKSISIGDARVAADFVNSDTLATYMPLPSDSQFDKGLTPIFTQDWAGASWGSVVTVKGWTGNYAVWQMAGNASTSTEDAWYLRTGSTSTWNAWKQIAVHGDDVTFGDITMDTGGVVNLDLNAAAGQDAIIRFEEGLSDKALLYWDASVDYFRFYSVTNGNSVWVYQEGTDNFFIEKDTNITGTLDVSATINGNDTADQWVIRTTPGTNTGTGIYNLTSNASSLIIRNGPDIDTILRSDASDSYINAVNGQLGVGTDTPLRTLDVDGTFGVSGNSLFDGSIGLSNGAALWASAGTGSDETAIHLIHPDNGVYRNEASPVTGQIKIVFQNTNMRRMLSGWIDMYNYSTDTAVSIFFGGYTIPGTPDRWINTQASYMNGGFGNARNRVEFCVEADGRFSIRLGTLVSTWSYPHVVVRNISLGYDSGSEDPSNFIEQIAIDTVAAPIIDRTVYPTEWNNANSKFLGYQGAEKLSTTSAGVDITGALTVNVTDADVGLTINTSETTTAADVELKFATSSNTNAARIGYLSSASTSFSILNNDGDVIIGTGSTTTVSSIHQFTTSGYNISGGTTDTRFIQIGENRTGDGTSFIDLIGDTTYSDYGTRLRREAGAGGRTRLRHRGTGDLDINSIDSSDINLIVGSTNRLTATTTGVDVTGTFGVSGTSTLGNISIGGNTINTTSGDLDIRATGILTLLDSGMEVQKSNRLFFGEVSSLYFNTGTDRRVGLAIGDDASVRNYVELFEGNNPVNQKFSVGMDNADVFSIVRDGTASFTGVANFNTSVAVNGSWTDNSLTGLDQLQIGDYASSNGIIIAIGATSSGALSFAESTTTVDSRIIYQATSNELQMQVAGTTILNLNGATNDATFADLVVASDFVFS